MLARNIIVILALAIFSAIWSIYQEQVTIPSCNILPPSNTNETILAGSSEDDPDDFTAVFVSNLLLVGPDASLSTFFRDYFMSKFLSKSFERLKPDMLIILGDVSAKGFQLTSKTWSSVLHRFQTVLGPYLQLPVHVTLGDRDIGVCMKLKSSLVQQVASSFPDLDSAGCGSFEISNISFLSLNSVALLCGNNELLCDVEKVIEGESAYIRMNAVDIKQQVLDLSETSEASNEFRWRETSALSQSGPVLLLHFPLHQISRSYCKHHSNHKANCNFLPDSLKLWNRVHADSEPYGLLQTVPPNATEYIFRALKPRMIFSAHNHEFCDFTHADGTREVTVPALAWTAKVDPGLIVAIFRRNGAVIIKHCSFPSESHVILGCVTIIALSLSTAIITNLFLLTDVRHNR